MCIYFNFLYLLIFSRSDSNSSLFCLTDLLPIPSLVTLVVTCHVINGLPNRQTLIFLILVWCTDFLFGLIHGLINITHGQFICIHHPQLLDTGFNSFENLCCYRPKTCVKSFFANLLTIILAAWLRSSPLIRNKHLPRNVCLEREILAKGDFFANYVLAALTSS